MISEPTVGRWGELPDHSTDDSTPSGFAVLTLVFLACIFNAIALFAEVQHVTPGDNDQVFHYLMIERAEQAIFAGDNPFDHWLPQLELGFPQFFYYQNLPHLVVVGLHLLLLRHVSLIRLLNLVRYLLMLTFPLTVYWSMRKMEFSAVAAASGAMVSSMLSCRLDFGFDYKNYLWQGFGMFPQLCAMHLIFIGTACVRRAIWYGRGFSAAIVATSALVLSDLLYAYIFTIVIALVFLLGIANRLSLGRGLRESLTQMVRPAARLAIVAIVAALITAYQTIPFLSQNRYLNRSFPSSIRGHPIAMTTPTPLLAELARLRLLGLKFPVTAKHLMIVLDGNFFDHNRLPVITSLVVVGIAYALLTRSQAAIFALTLLATWMALLIPGPLRSLAAHHLPLIDLLPLFRFVSGVDFGAILLAGLAGEFIWRCLRFRSIPRRLSAFLPLFVMLVFYSPMLVERWNFYRPAADAMDLTDQVLKDDGELAQIISTLKTLPPGRVYAGTRGNWGSWMSLGGIRVYDLLPIEQFATVMPWQTLSLNAPLLWKLNVPSLPICRLFNIRYVIAPPNLKLPDFYREIVSTSRYVLYQVDSGGYLQLGQVTRVEKMGFSEDLFDSNSNWMRSEDPAAARFIAYFSSTNRSRLDLATLLNQSPALETPDQLGLITDEVVTPDSLSARVTTNFPAVLVFKVTYHPNWHVIVDGHEQPAFMVSPSLIGTSLTPGHHEVSAEYKSSSLKKVLMVVAAITLVATLALGLLGYERRMLDKFPT